MNEEAQANDDGLQEAEPCTGGGFVRNDADKHAGARFSLVRAFACAGCGLAFAFRTQRNMKIHAAVAALESVVDLVSPEYSELARRAKDCAAGAVLVCALAALAVAAAVFLPHLCAWVAG